MRQGARLTIVQQTNCNIKHLFNWQENPSKFNNIRLGRVQLKWWLWWTNARFLQFTKLTTCWPPFQKGFQQRFYPLSLSPNLNQWKLTYVWIVLAKFISTIDFWRRFPFFYRQLVIPRETGQSLQVAFSYGHLNVEEDPLEDHSRPTSINL